MQPDVTGPWIFPFASRVPIYSFFFFLLSFFLSSFLYTKIADIHWLHPDMFSKPRPFLL